MEKDSNAVSSQIDENKLHTASIPTDKEAAVEAEAYRKSGFFRYFFPILPRERKRLILMTCMFCLISFTYTFMRISKDRIIYTVLDNTETKHWIKLICFFVTQSLVIFSQNISSKSDFNTAFSSLTVYFSGFLFCNMLFVAAAQYLNLPVFSNDIFTESVFVSSRLATRGLGIFYPLVLVFNFLPYSLYYILAEVVGSLMVSFCFMTYVNNNTTENQNKRFFKVLYFFSNLSSCGSAFITKKVSGFFKNKSKETNDLSFYFFTVGFIALYFLVLAFKKMLEKELENKIVISTAAPKKAGSKKKKIGFKDSIELMFTSRFLMYMASAAFFYNVCANLLDAANSSAMSASATFYNEEKTSYAGEFKSWDGIITALATAVIVISPLSMLTDKYGIGIFAAVPLIVSLFGAIIHAFFAIVNFPITGSDIVYPFSKLSYVIKYSDNIIQSKPLWESYAGTFFQTTIKIAKYAFYDIVKEAISMKIDPEIRPLFKGVFDGSITKFGKSIGSVYAICMYGIFESNDARFYFPITATIMIMFCFIWGKAIVYLNASYKKAKETETYVDPDLTSEIKLI